MGASLPRVLHSAPDTVPGCRTGGGSAKKKPGDSWKATRGEVVGVQNVFLGKVVDVEQLSSQMTSPSFTSPHGDLTKGPIIIPDEQKSFIEGIW